MEGNNNFRKSTVSYKGFKIKYSGCLETSLEIALLTFFFPFSHTNKSYLSLKTISYNPLTLLRKLQSYDKSIHYIFFNMKVEMVTDTVAYHVTTKQ